MKKFVLVFIIILFYSPINAQEEIVYLYDGAAPGSENWDWKEGIHASEELNSRLVYNVVKPSLTVFKPDQSISNGTSIVICPGGGFHFLAIDYEGYDVARWMNENGITAFVLKYRLVHSLTDNPLKEVMEKEADKEASDREMMSIVPLSISDGKAAVKYVRENAEKYSIDPQKIGIMGFSAGGTVTTGVALMYETIERPNFIAPIYAYVGSFDIPPVPVDAPPMFIAAATDDIFELQKHSIDLYEKWEGAKKSVELHIYAKGDHGFGMNKKNLPVDTWTDRFVDWLQMLNYIK